MSRSLNFVVSAPGKVILFGEHSVLYAQPALATSIDRRTVLKFQTTSDNVALNFENVNLNLSIPISKVNLILETIDSKIDNSVSGILNDQILLKAITENIEKIHEFSTLNSSQRVSVVCLFYLLYLLFHVKNQQVRPFSIQVVSQLVVGAGTGSSASFCVCLSAALFRFSKFIVDPEHDIEEFNEEQKASINDWAFACEQIIHGKASGLDNFVCVYGSMIDVSFGDNPKAKTFKVLDTILLRVLLINSGVNRNTAMMVKKVSELHDRNPEVTELVFKAIGQVTKTATQLLKELKNESEKSEKYANIFTKLEDLVSINHGLLSSLGVSHPTLNKIVEISAQFGLKSKLTGAGGGGYAFVLVPPYYPENELEWCKNSLQDAGFSVVDSKVGEKGLDMC